MKSLYYYPLCCVEKTITPFMLSKLLKIACYAILSPNIGFNLFVNFSFNLNRFCIFYFWNGLIVGLVDLSLCNSYATSSVSKKHYL